MVLDKKVAIPLCGIDLAVNAPTMVLDRKLDIPLCGIDLAVFAPSVGIGAFISVPLLEIDMATYAPTLVRDSKLSIPLVNIDTAVFAPTLSLGTTLTVPILEIDLATYTPTLVRDSKLAVPLSEIDLAVFAPTLVRDSKLGVPLCEIDMACYAPSIILIVYPSGALGYTIEVRDSAGNLLAIFENAFGISLTQQLNRPPTPASTTSQHDSSTVAPSESRLVIADEVRIRPMDSETLAAEYPNIDSMSCSELRDIPITKYGFYMSDSFFLKADSAIEISLESDCPVGSNAEGCDFAGGVWLEIEYIDDPENCVAGNLGSFESCNARRLPSGDYWETEFVYVTDRSGFYMVELTNESGESVFYEYRITTK